jgi:hypothetical protein
MFLAFSWKILLSGYGDVPKYLSEHHYLGFKIPFPCFNFKNSRDKLWFFSLNTFLSKPDA